MPNFCALLLAALAFTGAAPEPVPVRFSWKEARRLEENLHPRGLQELRSALRRLGETLRGLSAESLVVIYYSGHADGTQLQLNRTTQLPTFRDMDKLQAAYLTLLQDLCLNPVQYRNLDDVMKTIAVHDSTAPKVE